MGRIPARWSVMVAGWGKNRSGGLVNPRYKKAIIGTLEFFFLFPGFG